MTDREEFSFEEEKVPSGAESDISWREQETDGENPAFSDNGRKGSMTRILLLVLLLVAVGAAGFYFLLGAEEAAPPPPVQVAVKKQPIAVPSRPVVEVVPAEKEAPQLAEKAAVQLVEKAAAQAPEADTGKPAEEKAEAPPQKSPVAVQAPGEATAASSPGETPEPAVALAEGAYTVEAGAFLLRSNLAEAEEKVRESGFEPHVVRKKKMMDMTRLRIGIFSPEEGKKKIKELAALTPEAFYLPVDGKVAVYAASFRNLDTARSFADRLYKKGLRVEEESAKVGIPLDLLSFGRFADLKSAREAADRVRANGVEAIVVKNP